MVEIKKKEDETVVTPPIPAEDTNVQQVFWTDEIKAPPVVAQPVITPATAPIVQPTVKTPKSLAETQDTNIESYKAQDWTIQTRATTWRDWMTPMANTIPEIKPQTTKIEQPKVSTPITKETNWADIEKKDLNSLEQLVEARYWIVATQKDWKLVWNIGGKDYAWGLNNEGNPEKTDITAEPKRDEIFAQIASWQIVDKNNVDYQSAKKRYDRITKIKSLNDSQLQEAIAKWLLLPWTELYNDAMNDQAFAEKVKEMQNINLIKWEVPKEEDVLESKGNEILQSSIKVDWQEMTLEQAFANGSVSKDEYDQMTDSPELKVQRAELLKRQDEVSTLQSQYDTAEERMIEKLSWTWATTNAINTAIYNERKKILPQLNLSISLANNALWAIAQIKEDNTALFSLNYWEYKAKKEAQALESERAYKQSLIQDERAYNQSLTEDERKYQEQKRTTELEQEYAYTYWDLNSENTTLQNIAIERAVWDLYTKYPLPWMESQSAKVAKVKERMAMWMTGSEALSTVEAEIRGSERFKNLANPPKKSEYTEFWGNLYKIDSDWNIGLAISWPKQYSKLDDWTYQDNEGNIITKQEMEASNQSFDYNWLDKTSVLAEKNNVQCWKLVNTFIQDKTWSYGWMWDKYETKVNTINNIWKSSVPQVWWVFAFPYTSKDIWYNTGHTWIVTKVNQDWSIEVMEANIEGSNNWWPVRTGKYSAQSVKNMIFSKSLQNWWTQWWNAPLEYESQILNFVPKNQLDSPKEKNEIKQKIWELYNKWLSPEDAVLVYKWFDLKNKELAQKYLNIWTNLWDDLPNSYYWQVSNLLNKWDISWAEKYVSNIIEDKAKKRYWSDFVPTAWMNKMTKEFWEIRILIDKNRDKIGAVDWRLDNLYKKYWDIGEIQRLRTLMTGSLAELRKNFAWSAVTETELKALADYVSAGVIDNPDNLIEQFTTIRDMTKNTFLSQRAQFWYTPLWRDAKGNLKSQSTTIDNATTQNIDWFQININWAWSLQSDEQAELQKLFNN